MTLQVVTPASSPPRAVVTVTARSRLGATAADDGLIKEVVEDATRTGERVSGVRWIYRVYQERVTLSRATSRLWLNAHPIVAVTSIAFGTSPALTEGAAPNEFAIWPRNLYRENEWHAGDPGWLVTYTAGYWMPPSMTGPIPAGAESIDHEGVHLRRAVWETVQASWTSDEADPNVAEEEMQGQGGGKVRIKYRGGNGSGSRLVVPASAAAVFLAEGRIPV